MTFFAEMIEDSWMGSLVSEILILAKQFLD